MINVPNGDLKEFNFWKYNPNYILIFEDYYNNDKSKNKEHSSRIMWGLYLVLHPKSDFYNLPDKRELIKNKFIKINKFDWDTISKEESIFKDSILTQAERSLYEWNEFMNKRDRYLKGMEYYFDTYELDSNGNNKFSKTGKPILLKGTADQLDKAYSLTPKMYADYDKIIKSLKEEEYQTGKGNKIKSLSDSNDI